MGSSDKKIYVLDSIKDIIYNYDVPHSSNIVKHQEFVAFGGETGSVSIFDPRAKNVSMTINCHPGPIISMEYVVKNHYNQI